MSDNTKYLKDFVPYEQALALKKLDFNETCFGRYYYKESYPMLNPNSGETELVFEFGRCVKQTEVTILAPLYQQAFRWFREKYNIDAWVQPFVSEKHGKPFLPDESYAYYIFEDGVYVADGVNFLDSEEAELECLKKLIEIVKKQL